MSGNKTEEIGASRLALSQPSLAEQLEAAQKRAEILHTMRGIVSDHRENVHAQSTSMLPERSAPAPQAKGSGWIEPRKLEPPDGIDIIDRMCIADDAAQRAKAKQK